MPNQHLPLTMFFMLSMHLSFLLETCFDLQDQTQCINYSPYAPNAILRTHYLVIAKKSTKLWHSIG
jgi:hypothetical protein